MLDLTKPKTIWRAYTQMNNFLSQLPTYTADVIREVLDTGVTPELQDMARSAPEKEWQRYQILHMIGNGNPERLDSLTELAMEEIRIGLEEGDLP
ncbi:MAG: hypothetical protein PVG14_00200 [Anaerolineales bacterium]